MSMHAHARFDFRPTPPRSPDEVTFGDYAEIWLERQIHSFRAGLRSGNSIRKCESVLATHLLPFFAAYPLNEITRERCESFRAALFQSQTFAPRTINSLFALFGGILRCAIQDGEMSAPDPTHGMRPLAVPRRRVDCYTAGETHALLDAMDDRYRAIVGLASLAGLRRGEIFALDADDVDLEAEVIHVQRSLQIRNRLLEPAQRLGAPKSSAGIREVPIRAALKPFLVEHREIHGCENPFHLFFAGEDEGFVSANRLRQDGLWPAMERAGLRRIAFHDLRVTFITHCSEAGVPLAVIARWVGHASTRMTDYYVHSTRNTERDALALLQSYDRSQA